MWYFRPVGLGVQTSNNITIDGNIVARVVQRTTFFCSLCYDKEAGMSICAYHWPDNCKDVSVTNNIVAGVFYAGYLAPAHKCGEADT